MGKSVDKSGGDGSESNVPSPVKSAATTAAPSVDKVTRQVAKVNSNGADEENVSDSETNWESNDWGDMNLSVKADVQEKEEDGWNVDDEDWAPLETAAPPATLSRTNAPSASATASESSTSFTPTTTSSRKTEPATASNWATSDNATMKSENNWESSWNDTSEWKMNDSAAMEKDEARRQREDKRNARQGGGPLRLGAKKLAND